MSTDTKKIKEKDKIIKASFGKNIRTPTDIKLLNFELSGLVNKYSIDVKKKTVKILEKQNLLRKKISHLDYIDEIETDYHYFVSKYNNPNDYAFHGLFPYKGKFYPRLVRTLINGFNLTENDKILDPFNGSGTTTHEAGLMGIKSVGIDINPISTLIGQVKANLPILNINTLENLKENLLNIFNAVEHKNMQSNSTEINDLLELLYIDTLDAQTRSSFYASISTFNIYKSKFLQIIKDIKKLKRILNKLKIKYKRPEVFRENILNFYTKDKFSCVITSPPYLYSLDYINRNKIGLEYYNLTAEEIEKETLGKNSLFKDLKNDKSDVYNYFLELKDAYLKIFDVLRDDGKFGLVLGDSTLNGSKVPISDISINLCENIGFELLNDLNNPLLGTNTISIKEERILIFQK